jgi:hypothetical protein
MTAQLHNWKALTPLTDVAGGGLITLVLSSDGGAAFQCPEYAQKTGLPSLCRDGLIEALLLNKVALRLGLRTVASFARGMARLAQAQWPVASYSTLSSQRGEGHFGLKLPCATQPPCPGGCPAPQQIRKNRPERSVSK